METSKESRTQKCAHYGIAVFSILTTSHKSFNSWRITSKTGFPKMRFSFLVPLFRLFGPFGLDLKGLPIYIQFNHSLISIALLPHLHKIEFLMIKTPICNLL